VHITHVHIHVKPEHVEAFREAAVRNARSSVQEPGCARFDVIQSTEDPSRFVLVEIYRTEADAAHHKETAHYKEWRDAVAEMMAEAREGRRYRNVFPTDDGWA
jgi:quinol monooxygenase YgiN